VTADIGASFGSTAGAAIHRIKPAGRRLCRKIASEPAGFAARLLLPQPARVHIFDRFKSG